MPEQTTLFNPGVNFAPGAGTAYAQRILAATEPGSPARGELLRSALREVTAPARDALEESDTPETWRAYFREVLSALVTGLTLTEVLAFMGLSHIATAASGKPGHQDVLTDRGVLVFSGTASETWDWLRSTKRLP